LRWQSQYATTSSGVIGSSGFIPVLPVLDNQIVAHDSQRKFLSSY